MKCILALLVSFSAVAFSFSQSAFAVTCSLDASTSQPVYYIHPITKKISRGKVMSFSRLGWVANDDCTKACAKALVNLEREFRDKYSDRNASKRTRVSIRHDGPSDGECYFERLTKTYFII